MSEIVDAAVRALNAKLGGTGIDGSVRFVIEDEGAVRIDGDGAAADDGSEADCTLTASAETFQSLLDGECELFFKPGTMQFSGHAEAMVGWRAPPSVRLAMSFRSQGVELYYRLTLEAADAHVQLDLIRFEPPEASADGRCLRLATALGAARANRLSGQGGQLQARDAGYQGS